MSTINQLNNYILQTKERHKQINSAELVVEGTRKEKSLGQQPIGAIQAAQMKRAHQASGKGDQMRPHSSFNNLEKLQRHSNLSNKQQQVQSLNSAYANVTVPTETVDTRKFTNSTLDGKKEVGNAVSQG